MRYTFLHITHYLAQMKYMYCLCGEVYSPVELMCYTVRYMCLQDASVDTSPKAHAQSTGTCTCVWSHAVREALNITKAFVQSSNVTMMT